MCISRGKLGPVFGKISRGLETIRLVMPTSLSLSLVVHVARTLDARVRPLTGMSGGGDVVSRYRCMALEGYEWGGCSQWLQMYGP